MIRVTQPSRRFSVQKAPWGIGWFVMVDDFTFPRPRYHTYRGTWGEAMDIANAAAWEDPHG